MAFRWNPEAFLRCCACGSEYPMGRSSCDCAPESWTEAAYRVLEAPTGSVSDAVCWLRNHHQPLSNGDELNLGQGSTPLVPLRRFAPNLWLKDETANPTWSHKDRANATNAAVAVLSAASGMIASSTGNHAASVAAYAAAAGLPAVILCRPGMPEAAIEAVWAYGGIAASLDQQTAADIMGEFVESGWYAATSLDRTSNRLNTPYGAEAYKRIAWELAEQLGTTPSCVIVPTASGDTYYGIAKGFAELSALSGFPEPATIAVQPVMANPLERSVAIGRPVVVHSARSIALSIANEQTGRHALAVAAQSKGSVVSVTEEEIAKAVLDMARVGHLLDPASAAGLAAYRELVSYGYVEEDATSVLVGTASGTKWLRAIDPGVHNVPLSSVADLRREVRRRQTDRS